MASSNLEHEEYDCRPADVCAAGPRGHLRRAASILLALAAVVALLLSGDGGVGHAQDPPAVPDAPNVTARRGAETISLHLKEPDDRGSPITHYEYRARIGTSTVATTSYPTSWTRIADFDGVISTPSDVFVAVDALANGTKFTDLDQGNAYAFGVRAVSGAGAGDVAEVIADDDDDNLTLKANSPSTIMPSQEAGSIQRVPRAPAPRVPSEPETVIGHSISMIGSNIIEDGDGIEIADSGDDRFTFTFEWIRLKNGDETTIHTEKDRNRSSGYILTAADAGSQLKVRVTFRDDRYNLEEYVSPLFPPTGTILPAATCAPPTYEGGVTQIWSEQIDIAIVDDAEPMPSRFGVLNASDLGDNPFSVGSNNYTIDELYWENTGSGTGRLTFGLVADLTDRDRSQLTMHVCDQAYPLLGATLNAGNHDYEWFSTGDWSTYYGRTIFLSRDPDAPIVRSLVSNFAQGIDDEIGNRDEDFAQPFTTGSNPAGYTLYSIEYNGDLGGAPLLPSMKLLTGSATGTKVADFISPTAAGTGMFMYTPASPVTLASSTTYWFVSEGGEGVWYSTQAVDDPGAAPGWSIGDRYWFRNATSTGNFTQRMFDGALKIRVKGVVNNNPATGAPMITAPNVFRVPAALGVDLSSIGDANGATMIATTTTYRWQRFAGDGTTLEADNIGTSSTYTLSDADAGKRFQVSVSFTDDGGYSEGPLTSEATPVIDAAATCGAPTYVGGATQVGPARKLGVEQYTSGGITHYGFSSPRSIGSLDNITFTTAASNDYEILSIIDSNSFPLIIGFDTTLSAVDKSTLVLHVCDQAYAFGPATPEGNAYHLATSPLDWSPYAERTIYLSQDLAGPTFVDALVRGTSLEITFSEVLGEAASLATSSFTVKKGSGGTDTDADRLPLGLRAHGDGCARHGSYGDGHGREGGLHQADDGHCQQGGRQVRQ